MIGIVAKLVTASACTYLIYRFGLALRRAKSGTSAQAGTKANFDADPDSCILIPFHEKTYEFPCGHEGAVRCEWYIYGEWLSSTEDFAERSTLCPTCTLKECCKEVLRCAKCGRPIYPGKPITRYDRNNPVVNRKYLFGHPDDVAVGCMRGDCCENTMFWVGHWTGKELRLLVAPA